MVEKAAECWVKLMMYLFTYHGNFLAFDGSKLFQTPSIDDDRVIRWSLDGTAASADRGFISDFNLLNTPGGLCVEKNGKFASAAPNSFNIDIDKEQVYGWETFIPIDKSTYEMCRKAMTDATSERARFARRIENLIASNTPIKIYAGAGLVPRVGFINIDIEMQSPGFFVKNSEDYFIFPFVSRWDIQNDCVDYIFNEDFVEHISQLMQWQYLAEALRVLKPGAWHRINTPNIIATMKRHSDFKQGFGGVYTGEERWGHISILSQLQLKEIAETIGYREVIFTTKDHGVSPFAVEDFRPTSDRDKLTGNIYADLLK